MFTLHHYYLCSSSRYIRLILEEHNIRYETQLENFWKPQKDFLKINPAGHLPVLVNKESFPIIGANSCIDRGTKTVNRQRLYLLQIHQAGGPDH